MDEVLLLPLLGKSMQVGGRAVSACQEPLPAAMGPVATWQARNDVLMVNGVCCGSRPSQTAQEKKVNAGSNISISTSTKHKLA
jgi:hypothetical protein